MIPHSYGIRAFTITNNPLRTLLLKLRILPDYEHAYGLKTRVLVIDAMGTMRKIVAKTDGGIGFSDVADTAGGDLGREAIPVSKSSHRGSYLRLGHTKLYRPGGVEINK